METLAVVPARGGSKSIYKKNIHPLCGKPLIYYTIRSAKNSILSRTVVSTDDEEIASVAKSFGAEVPFLRPAELARDDTPSLPVIQHAVRFLEETEDYLPSIIVILQPTSPLRTSEHIDEAIHILVEAGADSVVSVIEVPHNFNPVSVMRIENGKLKPFLEGEGTRILRRQDKPRVFARNGAAVYAMTYETLMERNSLFGEDCRPFLMDEQASIDIDSQFNLRIAEMLLTSLHNSSVIK